MPQPDLSRWHCAYECLDSLSNNPTPASIYSVLVRTDEAAYYAWTLSALPPWEYVDGPKHTGKGRPHPPLPTLAAREGIKAPNRLCELITAAHNNRADILELKNAVVRNATHIRERDRFGMAIRHWDARGGYWRLQVLFCLLAEAMQRWQTEAKRSGEYFHPKHLKIWPCSYVSIAGNDNDNFVREWQMFLDHLQELDLMNAPSLKKIIDGTQLANALGIKPGKWMAKALEICVAWQLRHPDATDPAGALEEVNSRREELGIPSG
jgi:tRNA nucleotidyltransferase (CCA-adding enzyme)